MTAIDISSLPKVIASSVVRSAHQGESHGGVYIVDLSDGSFNHVIDWNDNSINWDGRGADRGLRGIAFYDSKVFLAASDELFVYDKHFNKIESYRNPYLKHTHEIYCCNHKLYLTSTGYDSILVFDIRRGAFEYGLLVRADSNTKALKFGRFDPNSNKGPSPGDTVHMNSVYVLDDEIFIGCLRLPILLSVKSNNEVHSYAKIPMGSHNARPFEDGVILNDTASDRLALLNRDGKLLKTWSIVKYEEVQLENSELPTDHARQGFGRGLCLTDQGLIVGGSSPSTISIFDASSEELVNSINLTMDIRNSIHGLEIWPF